MWAGNVPFDFGLSGAFGGSGGDSLRSLGFDAFVTALNALGLGVTVEEWEGEERLFNPNSQTADIRVRYLGCSLGSDQEMGGTSYGRSLRLAVYVTAATAADARDVLEQIEEGVSDRRLTAGTEILYADCQGESEAGSWQGLLVYSQDWTLTHLKG